MTDPIRITILGCGGSGGVPLIGNDWGDCDPEEPRNRRRRSSVLVSQGDRRLLIDTGPDLRAQLLDADVRTIDAVLYTHDHADHLNGIDDLRQVCRQARRSMDIYSEEPVLSAIQRRFAYAFREPDPRREFYRPSLVPHRIDGPFEAAGFHVLPFRQAHGAVMTTGFRIGPFAYSTDVVGLDDDAFRILDGISLWVVDAQQPQPHPTHSHFEQTLEWIARVGPDRAVLTHMNQRSDYKSLLEKCPAGVVPGHDGLVIEVTDPAESAD